MQKVIISQMDTKTLETMMLVFKPGTTMHEFVREQLHISMVRVLIFRMIVSQTASLYVEWLLVIRDRETDEQYFVNQVQT